MSKLNIDQKTVLDLFANKHSDFLIPDYQRPYAWGEDECETLWDDLKGFTFPGNSSQEFDSNNDEYFLGPIVTFKNADGKQEIIDGQQRLTTMMLLLRAFYTKFLHAQDDDTVDTRKLIASCIWKTNEMGRPIFDKLKIDSEVASDDDKDEFLTILKTGEAEDSMRSRYAAVYCFFSAQIAAFVDEMPMYTAFFPMRIMKNVILLPIEAESQDTALRIFSTLNDRGLPLSDADIFKSQFYKFYSSLGKKNAFLARWKALEEGASALFRPLRGTPMDELFTRYMYYRRALDGITGTTMVSLRDFYSGGDYAILKNDTTLGDLEALLSFWQDIDAQTGFSDRALKRLFVLNYSPNGMWTYLLSAWFLTRHRNGADIDDDELCTFLDTISGFIFAYAIERPGVNALRSPVFPEMRNIVDGKPATFAGRLANRTALERMFRSYAFTNGRPVTKSLLTWWAFHDERQGLIKPLATPLQIEHIYAKKRNELSPLANRSNLEALGNKSILERSVNVRAADFKFGDKRRLYRGYVNDKGKAMDGTSIAELRNMAETMDDFTETDIEERTDLIIGSFMDWLESLGLLQG